MILHCSLICDFPGTDICQTVWCSLAVILCFMLFRHREHQTSTQMMSALKSWWAVAECCDDAVMCSCSTRSRSRVSLSRKFRCSVQRVGQSRVLALLLAAIGAYSISDWLPHFGDRCFAAAGPRLWNTLPLNLRLCDSLGQFKQLLKTFLFGLWDHVAL